MSRLAQVLVGCALLTSGCMRLDFWRRAEASPVLAQGPQIGVVAPDLEGEDFDGQHVKLDQYRGKVVVVVFWASWCRPCREMIPQERALVERYRDKPFVMLSVNNDENFDAARKVMAAEGISWRCLPTGGWDNPVNQRWKIKAIPAIFVLDERGVIRQAHARGADLDRMVAVLIAEAESKRPG